DPSKPADLKPVPNEAKTQPTPAGAPADAPALPLPPPATGVTPPGPRPATTPAPGAAPAEDPLVKVFGQGGMNLKAVGDGGGMNAEFNPDTQEMTTMHIWGKIDLTSELMNLQCD